MKPIVFRSMSAASCLGTGLQAHADSLLAQRCGLRRCDFETVQLDTYVGETDRVDRERLPAALARFESRNNRLAQLALTQIEFRSAVADSVRRYGAGRIGVFLGTSTSGMLDTELAYRARDPVTGLLPASLDYAGSHNFYSAAAFTRALLGLEGPAAVVSTACSSSAKVFGMAARMIGLGLIEAAIVGGVDSLCLTTLYGFHSLQLTSSTPCRPFDAHRDGISVGEAAAFVLLDGDAHAGSHAGVGLLGIGESSDAYHLSTPHPEGLGARLAMQAALRAAALEPSQIDYINLHGTGTVSNDTAEGRAVAAVFGNTTRCSSTKGATGHTLGAAGALEAVICALAIQHGFMPGGVNCQELDPGCTIDYIRRNEPLRPQRVLSNSFGFGGSNCSLVFGALS
jgi:3-oxoacyl-[acyl-carrier-protein] synthase-1